MTGSRPSWKPWSASQSVSFAPRHDSQPDDRERGLTSTAPVEGLRSRKKREMRERLVTSARTLFARHGFEGTTIEAIARMADVSKPTVFNYFPSKATLLHELVLRADSNFFQLVEAARKKRDTTSARLEYFFQRLGELTQQDPGLSRVLMVEAVKSMDGQEGAALPHRFGRTEQALVDLLQDGAKAGEVRKDYSVQLLAQLMVGAYTNILLLWLADPNHFPLHEKLQQTADFLAGVVFGGLSRGRRWLRRGSRRSAAAFRAGGSDWGRPARAAGCWCRRPPSAGPAAARCSPGALRRPWPHPGAGPPGPVRCGQSGGAERLLPGRPWT